MDYELKYPHLFSPIRIAGQTFKNRIFGAPTAYVNQDKEGMFPPEAAMYYSRKAMGGVASVTVGGCNVDSEYGVGYGYNIRLDNNFSGDPYCFHGITRVAEMVSRQGAVCCGELLHAGMYANRWQDPPGPAFGPVDCVENGRTVRAMDEEMIERTIRKYAEGAAYLKKCGFGMIQLHAGHGWMLHQFLSPKLNTRTDKWGGPDIENRARLTVAVCDAIRKAVGPAFPIEVRISGSECYEGGYDIEEGIAFAKQLEGHCDLIHVSAGSHEIEEVFTVTHPSIFHEDGCNVKFAEAIKKNVSTKVATVGALATPELMEEIIATGKADVVELARGLFADPDYANKARAGKSEEINTCIRCLAGFSNLMRTGHFRCAINPKLGWEYERHFDTPQAQPKKVLVAGGGVAGMQAAITAAERGHQVILCEKSERLGGALKCEEKVPFKRLLDSYLKRQADKVARMGVEIRLNTTVSPELAREIAPDAIISALGATPVVPKITGMDRDNVLSAEYAYTHAEEIGRNVTVIGSGLVGMELAISLSMLGKKVIIIERANQVADGGNYQHMKGVNMQIAKYGIKTYLSTETTEIDDTGIVCKSLIDGSVTHFDADTVIYAVGQRPLTEETYALGSCAPEFYPVGDCMQPKDIMNATSMAFMAAQNVGTL